jgi:hypothetical protein
MELNTITLAKMKDYITKNIDTIKNDENIADKIASSANINGEPQTITENNTVFLSTPLTNTEPPYNYKEEYNYNNGDILTNEELLIRVKEYEHKRTISNTILANIENSSISLDNRVSNITNTTGSAVNTVNNVNTSLIQEIMDKVLTSLNTNANTYVNKKTLIINSYSRDWINNPIRNQLSFTVNIDLQNNIIQPLKILFPKYVKDITPYIILVITDNHKTFKYNFLYSKTCGKWDIWKLINKDNNINNNINLANKNWKINFLDYLNNNLNLGRDDIKISQINDYKMN